MGLSGLPGVVRATDTLYACADSGQSLIKEDIKKYNLNRVVVSACSVRMHETTFRGAVAEAGSEPFLMEMANIREQCTWAHGHDKRRRTEKGQRPDRGSAVAKARFLTDLWNSSHVPVTQTRHGHRRRRGRHQRSPRPGGSGHRNHSGGERTDHWRGHGAVEQDLPHHGL